jgi:hypothetical protein
MIPVLRSYLLLMLQLNFLFVRLLSTLCTTCSLEFIRRQVLRILHTLDKLILFDTSAAFDVSIRQDLLELLDTKLGYILLFHLFRFNGEPHGTDFRIALGNPLAHLECGHAERERLRNVAFDGINVFFSRADRVSLPQ